MALVGFACMKKITLFFFIKFNSTCGRLTLSHTGARSHTHSPTHCALTYFPIPWQVATLLSSFFFLLSTRRSSNYTFGDRTYTAMTVVATRPSNKKYKNKKNIETCCQCLFDFIVSLFRCVYSNCFSFAFAISVYVWATTTVPNSSFINDND